jgi:NAD-dependent SIR2 family protein deacetylase
MYYCNNCHTKISDEDILFDSWDGIDRCPECKSSDVEYFDCDIYEADPEDKFEKP